MELTDRVVVVTGGASGIGRSLCLAAAAAGARAVVVADVDGPGAQAVADEITGTQALAIPTDVSKEADVQALVTKTEEAFGPVDLFVSNAGIVVGGGVDVPDELWQKIWAINVQSHIYAARAVLPGMVARGEGYLVHTASAAGLLTQLGSAPYSVTKHAVVALAEWLSITYGDRGVRVSCLCPQAVATNLGATSRRQLDPDAPPDRPGNGAASPTPAGQRRGAAISPAALDGVLSPEDVAQMVLDAVRAEQFLILPHPEVATYERRRADDRERWLAGMRRMQARLTGRS